MPISIMQILARLKYWNKPLFPPVLFVERWISRMNHAQRKNVPVVAAKNITSTEILKVSLI